MIVAATPGAPPSDQKPKTFWDRLNPSVLLPLLVALTLAAAAWKTGETTSWKTASDGNKELVGVLKQQLELAQKENQGPKAKNDDLESDVRELLKTAADQKSDLATLSDKINKLLSKYKTPPAGRTDGQANAATTSAAVQPTH